MNPPEAFWVAQCRDSYPGCQPLKETCGWASSLKMDLAGLEAGPRDEPCDKPLIRARAASWDQPQGRLTYKGHRSASGRQRQPLVPDTLSSLLCWRGATVIVYVKVTVQTNDSNKLLSLQLALDLRPCWATFALPDAEQSWVAIVVVKSNGRNGSFEHQNGRSQVCIYLQPSVRLQFFFT
ncbi:putative protein ATP11AUN [Sapajus apella]|uniref:Uncharacterized protein n=1 Tax=Sapajus apella TaxID=9515 RepID=A0A6J3F9E1_SAPAP|nr:putative protein ATP11AUN [Sapajus apella]